MSLLGRTATRTWKCKSEQHEYLFPVTQGIMVAGTVGEPYSLPPMSPRYDLHVGTICRLGWMVFSSALQGFCPGSPILSPQSGLTVNLTWFNLKGSYIYA